MKKNIILYCIFFLTLCLILSGCSQTTPEPTESVSNNTASPSQTPDQSTPSPTEFVLPTPTPDMRDPLVWDGSYEGKLYNIKYNMENSGTYLWGSIPLKVNGKWTYQAEELKTVVRKDIPKTIKFDFLGDTFDLIYEKESKQLGDFFWDSYCSPEGLKVTFTEDGGLNSIGLINLGKKYGVLTDACEMKENEIKAYYEDLLSEYIDFSQFNTSYVIYIEIDGKRYPSRIYYQNYYNGILRLPCAGIFISSNSEYNTHLSGLLLKVQPDILAEYDLSITEEEVDNSILKSIVDTFGEDDTYVPVGFKRDIAPEFTLYQNKPVILATVRIEFKDRKTSAPAHILTKILIPLED